MTEILWFNKYYNNENKYNIDKFEDNINKISNSNENIFENKIIQIESEYQNKLQEIKLLYENREEINNLKKKSSLIILQKELDIIKLFTKYTLQNKTLDYDYFINCLNILLELSETLRIRLGQKEINNDKIIQQNDESVIPRCSYKFCSYQDNCIYNYNLKSKSVCYQDHYVHNMVSYDLRILLNYIKNKYSDTKVILHNKEILKSINTISYVISHMELELKTKCLYIPENEWELCHYVKNK